MVKKVIEPKLHLDGVAFWVLNNWTIKSTEGWHMGKINVFFIFIKNKITPQ